MTVTLATIGNFILFFTDALVYSISLIFWRLLEIVNNIVEIIDGRPRDSVQIGRIIWRRSLYIYIKTAPSDFLCFTYTPVHPDYVLKPNVSLYCATQSEAVFKWWRRRKV